MITLEHILGGKTGKLAISLSRRWGPGVHGAGLAPVAVQPLDMLAGGKLVIEHFRFGQANQNIDSETMLWLLTQGNMPFRIGQHR